MLNIFLITSLIPFITMGTPTKNITTIVEQPPAEVSVTWLCGNWQVKAMQRNKEKVYCRDAFRFFDDKTGFQGKRARFEWQTNGKSLVVTTYKLGIRKVIKWKVKRSKNDTLVMNRIVSFYKNGERKDKLIQVELERK